jgi:hypothetical protein
VIAGTWPEAGSSPIFIRIYEGGNYGELIEAFRSDAVLLLAQGYEPAGQHYVEGEWPLAMAVVATILLVFVIGAFLWAYLLVKHPNGSLTVTYVYRAATT